MTMVYGDPSKEVIGEVDCHDCQSAVTVKLNRNRIAYYYCPICSAHAKWGRATTNAMIAAHAKGGGAANDNDKGTDDVMVSAGEDDKRGEQIASDGHGGGRHGESAAGAGAGKRQRGRDSDPLFAGVFRRAA